jgi:uncharacterized protein (TIGR03435 family)
VLDATMPPDATKAQLRVMFQNLLAERFKLTFHRETKEIPGYSLLVAKSGLKMKESAAAHRKDDRDFDADGFPISGSQEEGGCGPSAWRALEAVWVANKRRCRIW